MFLPQLFLLTVLAAMLSSRLRTSSPYSPGGISRPRPPVGCVGESRSVGGIGFRAAPTQKESLPLLRLKQMQDMELLNMVIRLPEFAL